MDHLDILKQGVHEGVKKGLLYIRYNRGKQREVVRDNANVKSCAQMTD